VDKIPEAVELALKTGCGSLVSSDRRFIKPNLPKVRLNPVVEPLQIAEGCLGTCTYCCVRFARGRLLSYPPQIIAERTVSAVAEGVKEVWLTAQDVGAYGSDIGTELPALLKKVCGVEGQFFVRVGMINPNHALRLGEPLIESFKHQKVFKFLHVPVQSGNNSVLKDMNRAYTVEGFRSVVESFRSEIPDVTVATDVICGFPKESRDAFEDSIALLEDLKVDVVNVSRFFPRPGTVTSGMRQLPIEEIEQRSREISEIVKRMSLERNRRWQDWKGTVLIDEKDRSGSWVGRNYAYKSIVVRSSDNLLGETVKVVVRAAHPTYLEAEICR
jgi:MiaB-like tRNA modifying enzyme